MPVTGLKAGLAITKKILEAMGEILESKDVVVVGDKMRRTRNMDLYDAEGHYSEEEIKAYTKFIEKLLRTC